jgi:uncharacterized protein YgbK (DUF1537 family)
MRLGVDEDGAVAEAGDKAVAEISDGPVLVFASSPPAQVAAAQERYGAAEIGEKIERALARVARELVEAGVTRLIVAGGETSGAVVRELGVSGIRIGPQIDPGIPWTVTIGDRQLALALKSGNFGSEDFFLKAFKELP